MPLAGLVLNRVHTTGAPGLSAARATAGAESLDETGSHKLAAGLLRLHAERSRIVARESRLRARFAAAHPDVPTAVVPALSTDVHDLDGLRTVGDLLSQRS
jgi:hypothetical protein